MELRPYQEEDKQQILAKKRLGLFNQQRTGKTPTSIVAMDEMCSKILVVVPASMVPVWADEIATWTDKEVFMYHSGLSTQARRRMLDAYKIRSGFLVVSFNQFRNASGTLRSELIKCKPDGLIVDEAHRAVGRKTETHKSLKQVRHIPHRVYLSGTPTPNHPSQVWSLLTLIDPQRFTSYWRFVEEYFEINDVRLPNHMAYRTGISTIQEPSGFLPDKDIEFARLLDEYCIMRKRDEVMPWLPKQEELQLIKLEQTPKQRKEFEQLRDYFKVGDTRVQGILDQLIRVRQIFTHPDVLGIKSKNPKTEWIINYMRDYPEKQLIIFSRFTTYLKHLSVVLPAGVGLYVGGMSGAEKQALKSQFQSGKLKVLLIQIDAGKEGLTLDAADTLIFTDIFPPVSDIDQAKDRIIATTKDRVKPYSIIGLCIKDTYDEELYHAYKERKSLTDVANDYINFIRRHDNE